MRELDPERYQRLRVSMQIISKDEHPLNGYVDTLAFTWGSPSPASKERLRRAALSGHCLLRPSDHDALQRLYLAVERGRALGTEDWFNLCKAAATDVPDGLLGSFLTQLGIRAETDQTYWYSCLDEVRRRLAEKQFTPQELVYTLGWLQRWQPDPNSLAPLWRLRLLAARLSADNHIGQVASSVIMECLQLARSLEDEAAQEVCESLLRVSVATFNSFEFDAMQAELERWKALPIAIPGLLNHAKLHSSIGQIHAFKGEYTQALAAFERALEHFDRLSDPQQRQREAAQTRSYQLTVLLDHPRLPAQQLIDELLQHLGKPDPCALSRSLAQSTSSRRFEHHLWLRALCLLDAPIAAAREAYLAEQPQWCFDEGHPWPLINAMRAWLLTDAGQTEAANTLMQRAIDACELPDQGQVLHWMGAVLRVLAQALGLNSVQTIDSNLFATQLPAAPLQALHDFADQAQAGRLERPQLLQALQATLPFNYH